MVTPVVYTLPQLWDRFEREFPTEQHCLEELYQRSCVQGLASCRYCGDEILARTFGGRVVRCSKCQKVTWLTAGTFFHHVRIARPWLGAIWLLEHGAVINCARFQKLAGVAYSTAWSIFKKLATVVQAEMDCTALAIHSSLFLPVICRRSRETPARLPPGAEQAEIEQDSLTDTEHLTPVVEHQKSAEGGTGSPSNSLDLPPGQKTVYDLLESGATQFDVLCQRSALSAGPLSSILTLLELDGHVRRQVGDWYVRTSKGRSQIDNPQSTSHKVPEATTDIAHLITEFINFTKKKFQGISLKYLQNYLALYWCKSDRIRWRTGTLMQACKQYGPVRNCDILSYVTPAIVMVCPVQERPNSRVRPKQLGF